MSRFCPACGAPAPATAQFCGRCRARLPQVASLTPVAIADPPRSRLRLAGPPLTLAPPAALAAGLVLLLLILATIGSIGFAATRLGRPQAPTPALVSQALVLDAPAAAAAKAVPSTPPLSCVDTLCDSSPATPDKWHVVSLDPTSICFSPNDDGRFTACLGSYSTTSASASGLLDSSIQSDQTNLGATVCLAKHAQMLNQFQGQTADTCYTYTAQGGGAPYDVAKLYLYSTDTYGVSVYYFTFVGPTENNSTPWSQFVNSTGMTNIVKNARFKLS